MNFNRLHCHFIARSRLISILTLKVQLRNLFHTVPRAKSVKPNFIILLTQERKHLVLEMNVISFDCVCVGVCVVSIQHILQNLLSIDFV